MVGAQGLFRYASFTALIGFADRRTSVRLSLVVGLARKLCPKAVANSLQSLVL